MDRLRIVIEFKKGDIKELQLYSKLINFTSPSATIKDILKGNIPLEVLEEGEK